MKKIIILSIAICLFQEAISQNSSPGKDSIRYRHEFGLDATAFIKQFLNLNINGSQPVYPVYYLTYRFHSKKSNFRIGVGGEYTKKNAKQSSLNNPNREYDIYRSVYYRFGYEYYKPLSTKWSVFYGLDFRPSVSYNKNDNTNQSIGYTVGMISDSKILGLAPFLGAKFQINKRISLQTETSLSINYSETKTRNFYTPNSESLPPKMEDSHRDTYTWYTLFNPPVFVIFAFDI